MVRLSTKSSASVDDDIVVGLTRTTGTGPLSLSLLERDHDCASIMERVNND